MSIPRAASGDPSEDKASNGASQTPPTPDTPETLRATAEETVKKTAETLRQFPLPHGVEPAFAFKA